ncbi:MAG: hypothetical protein R2756_10770 [Bacteroidales bacterium]
MPLRLCRQRVSSSDSKVDRGGALAAFFLGVTTVLVSFSCTGPIVGALLVEAASVMCFVLNY